MSISTDRLERILSEYDREIEINTSFTYSCARLIREILAANRVKCHSVDSRVKLRDSLRRKVQNSTRYRSLHDVTDICGVRIITYFADEVDKVARIIEKEFQIDKEHSIDKRGMLEPDRFGYMSLHYVAKMSPRRLRFTENRGFAECQLEIQIRSILQHSWAEIQHDLGYKTEWSVPRELQRRFSRLAGVLETADDEFTAIRQDFETYEKQVKTEINTVPESVTIDIASLKAFLQESKAVRQLDESIAGIMNATLTSVRVSYDQLQQIALVGFKTIADIDRELAAQAKILPKFAQLWIAGEKFSDVGRGVSLFYLCYLVLAKQGSIEKITDYLKTFNIGDVDEDPADLAKTVLATYRKAAEK